MKFKHIMLPVTLIFIGGTSSAGASERAARVILNDMHSPEKQNSILKSLVGQWRGRGTVKPSRSFSKMKVKCNLANSWILQGKILKQSMTCKSFLMTISRTTYLGYDKATSRFVGKSYGNAGPDNAAISGTGRRGNLDLMMLHPKKSGSGTVQNRMIMQMSNANTIHNVMTKQSRNPYDVMRITFSRR